MGRESRHNQLVRSGALGPPGTTWTRHFGGVSAPLREVSPSGNKTILAGAEVAGRPVEIDAREYCKEQATLKPDPAGDIVSSFTVANGHVRATYDERITRTANGSETVVVGDGPVIPPEEAEVRIAAQRASKTSLCRTAEQRDLRLPECTGS